MATLKIISKGRKNPNVISIVLKVSLENRDRAEKALFRMDKKYYNEKTQRVRNTFEFADHYNNIIVTEMNNANLQLRRYELSNKPFRAKDIFNPFINRNKLTEISLNYSKLFTNRTSQKYLNLARYINLFDGEITLDKIDIEFMTTFKNFLTEHSQSQPVLP